MKISKLLPIIGISIFVFILSKLNLAEVWNSLKNVNLLLFGLTLLMALPIWMVKTVKWNMLIKPYGFQFKMWEGIKVWLIGFSIGLLTPGKVGDFFKAFYVNKEGDVPLGKAITTVIFERMGDVAVLFLLAAIGSTYLLKKYAVGGNMAIFVVSGFALICFAIGILTKGEIVKKMLKPIYKFFIPEKYKGVAASSFREFYEGMEQLKNEKKMLVVFTTLTIISWFLVFAQVYVLVLALNVHLSYFFLVLIMPIVLLVEVLPISFSGIGTRDAAMIAMLSLASVPASIAVSLSLSMLVMNYISGGVGLVFWAKNPIELG